MIRAILATAAAAVAADRLILSRKPPPPFIPGAGDVFTSRSEGVTQRILLRQDGRLWVESTLDPGAEGPPPHVHRTFDEHVVVAEGTLHMELGGETITVGAGEDRRIPAGTPHRLFNPGPERTVLRAPAEPRYALPEEFGVFLSQAYGYFDESPGNARPPRVLLQMSRWAPRFDTWLAGPPILGQRLLFLLLGPVAAVLGYRPWYGRFAPSQETADDQTDDPVDDPAGDRAAHDETPT